MIQPGGPNAETPGPGAEPDLVVDSVTGVDLSLPIAGPGARSYAFIIDWHIRAVLFVAWFVVAALIYNGRWSLATPADPSGAWFGFVVLPGAAIYFLYHGVLEILMRGKTPGKRMAGVRLVTRDGAAPAVPAYLIRNVFRLIDSFPVFYGVGLITTLVTRNHVRIGDMAAGTLLVYDRADESLLQHVSGTAIGSRLDASTAELINDLLQRWDALDVEVRNRLARTLLERLGGKPEALMAAQDVELRAQLADLAQGTSP